MVLTPFLAWLGHQREAKFLDHHSPQRFGEEWILLAIRFFTTQHLWVTDKMIMEVVAEIV